MGLHAIDLEQNTIAHHCNNPDCVYHNCANWEAYQQCAHHDELEHVMVPAAEMQTRLKGAIPDEHLANIGDTIISQPSTRGRRQGQTRVLPIDHPDIQYTGPGVVALPTCEECGGTLFLKVTFTEQEMKAPNIEMVIRDTGNPSIIQELRQHPMVARHQALHNRLQAIGRVYTPPPVVNAPAMNLAALVDTLKANGLMVVPGGDDLPPAA